MITNKNDYLGKELVKTFSYTSATQDRKAYGTVVINGRKYIKTGTLQAVTVVCNVYKIYNSDSQLTEYWAHFGLSKQNPIDIKVDKQIGYEIANNNSINNPFWIMQVNKSFNEYAFRDLVRIYVDNMELEFVKTGEEIKIYEQNK